MRNGILAFKSSAVAPVASAPRPRHAQFVVAFKAAAVDENARTFEGLLSTWGLDLGDDVMHKGAFKKTLAEWKSSGDALPLLNSHNHYDIMSSVGQLLDAKETADGLWTKWEVIPGPDGDRVLDRIRPGSNGRSPIGKMSIGYEPLKFDFEQSDSARFGKIRNLREVGLKEGSLVIFPMAPGARLDPLSVKSFLDDANATDPADVTAEAKADLRRLASRIGLLLGRKADDSSTVPAPTAPADPAEPGVTEPVDPATPATVEPTPAPSSDPAGSKGEKTEEEYPFTDALRQRILGLKVSSAINSTSTIL